MNGGFSAESKNDKGDVMRDAIVPSFHSSIDRFCESATLR